LGSTSWPHIAHLQGLADRTGLASLARFVDDIVIAVEWVTVSTSLELVHRRRVDRPKMSLMPC